VLSVHWKHGEESTSISESISEFITAAKALHSNDGVARYDYSNVVYQGCAGKVNIICQVHGTFDQQTSLHLKGQGCPACTHCAPLTTDIFSQRPVLHDGRYRYTYNKVDYVNNNTKVIMPLCYFFTRSR